MSIFVPNARILGTRHLAGGEGVGGLYRSEIALGEVLGPPAPGQFFMVRASGSSSDPLLPRALSALDYDPKRKVLSVCYRVYGAGTAALAALAKGAALEARGPYGNGFDLAEAAGAGEILLVGGGVGVPPLYLLAKALGKKKKRVTLFQGARSKGELLLVGEFARLGVHARISTDDGSRGFAGRVGALLGEQLPGVSKDSLVIACGPHPMMKDVAERCARAGLSCRVSLEEKMACATGVCLGCVVRLETDGGPKYVPTCTKGPVFDAARVVW